MNPAERLIRAPFALTGRAAEAAWTETLEQGVLERAVAEAARLGTIDRLVDELIAAGLLDRIADALVERGVVDHVVSAAVERGLIDRIVDELFESGAIARVASSSEVRVGLAQTSAGLADDLLRSLRESAARADDSAGRLTTKIFRRRRAGIAQARPEAAGLVSRLTALLIDALVVIGAGLVVSGAAAIVVSLFGQVDLATVFGVLTAAATSTVATVAYFALSWALVGQTVGMRAVAVRVAGPDGRPPSFVRALLLVFATAVSAGLVFAGYLPILWEPRRLALQDRVTRTRVTYAPAPD